MIEQLTQFTDDAAKGHRLINSKLPAIDLFDDVADADEFEALFAIQALTNPRIQTEVGNLALISLNDIPFGIPGCNYAAASFTHVNSDGSRFSDGSYGLFYVADTLDTATAEVRHHQNRYWSNVPELHFDRIVFKELVCRFGVDDGLDASQLSNKDPIYAPADYSVSQGLGLQMRQAGHCSLRYNSVRNEGGVCHALFTPRLVTSVNQSKYLEMTYADGRVQSVNRVSLG